MNTYCVEAQSGEKLSKKQLLETLDFIFQDILPQQGYTLRYEQLALARDIFVALERRSVLLSEAGVGIGKTHAYLIAAALVKRGNLNDFWLRGNYPSMAYIAKMPVVIATSSIALQKAIAQDYIPALFTYYRVMEQVFALLGRRGLGYPLFLLARGGLNTIEQFRQSGNGVLFASGSMWEGIDLPGDILSLLVIVKLPFAVPDPIGEHQRSQFENAADYKNAVVILEMLVRLKQGFGRLIRTETDTGVVALLDSRMRIGGAYRGRVLAELPDCPITSDIKTISSFIRAQKPAFYYKNIDGEEK